MFAFACLLANKTNPRAESIYLIGSILTTISRFLHWLTGSIFFGMQYWQGFKQLGDYNA